MRALADAVSAAARRLRGEDVGSVRRRLGRAGVDRSFVICTTPRSGSNMLGRLLAGTGLVGLAGERFNRYEVPDLADRRPGDYLVACAQDARGTAVFGLKLHWDQLPRFFGLIRRLRGTSGLSERELIEAVLPGPRFVWLRRDDSVAQGVSWWKAEKSGAWIGGRPAVGAATFDFEGIDELVRRVEKENEAWGHWFAANGLDPLVVIYEELAAQPAAAGRRVLEFLGIAIPDGLTIEPRTKPQSDDLNADWIRRYRSM
jgi:LPS sulfotransferase NodH